MYIGQDLQVAFQSYKVIDDISSSFNGSTTSFALLVNGSAPVPLPINSQQCLISVAGVIQRPDDTGTEGFRLSGGNIVFSSAPATGADFFGVILAGADYINAGGTFPDGSAAAPSITFNSDSDTGIYYSGANQLSISTGGTERSRFTSNGELQSVSLGTASAPAYGFVNDPNTGIYSPGADSVAISTNGSQRATVDSSGRLLVGTSTARSNLYNSTFTSPFQVEGTSYNTAGGLFVCNANDATTASVLNLAKTRGTSVGSNTVVQSGDLLGIVDFLGSDGSELVEAAFIGAYVDGTPGANDMPGRLVFSTTADGASSPTERMRIGQSGNASLGTTLDSGYRLHLQQASAAVVYINRTGNDGSLIDFYQDGTIEGSITVSGTTVSYNGAHLSRWSQLPGGAEREEILRGTVLSNIDEMCDWEEEQNEQLNRMKVSDVEGDRNVAGVFQAWDDDDDTYTNDFYCAMTGDFIIRIAEGVTVQRGDLLMSAGDGTAKPQDDDIIRSKTIAKVTSTHVTCTYDDGSYCVPCVLMAC